MIRSFFRDFFDSDLKISILLFVIAVVSYWEISLLQFSVHNDMLDVVLPWRFHVGECLRHNIFPFWNPFQSTGYPIHADLQCPSFYPETILVGSVFGYSNIILHILFTLYIFLAGLGMYKLLRHFGAIQFAAFLTGAAFMLSGVFVSHVQHFFAIIGFTWIPWVVLYYLRMSEDPWQFRHILPLSVFSFLMVSGGYQALSIILAYLVLALFIYYIVRNLARKNRKTLFRLILSNLTWLGLLLLFSAVILVSTWNVYDYIERFSGLTYEQVLQNPFTPTSLVSLVAPYGAVFDREFLRTDLSMSNMYTGVIIIVFFLTGLFSKQRGEKYVILLFGIGSMLAAFGDYLPVRSFLYKYLPMMDLFRLPAYFRFFMVIPVFILAGTALSDLLKDTGKVRKLFTLSFFLTGLGVMAFFIWSAAQIHGNQFILFNPDLSAGEKLLQAPVYEILMFNSLFILVFLIVFFLLFYYKVLNMKILFSTFILLEMFIAVQMNITYTGCSADWHPLKIRSQIRMHPQGFPVPLPDKIVENTDKACTFQPLWRNVNIFNKSVSFDCFTSFKFTGYKHLEDSVPQFKDAILQNPVIYLSDEVYPESGLSAGMKGNPGTESHLRTEEFYPEPGLSAGIRANPGTESHLRTKEFYPEPGLSADIQANSGPRSLFLPDETFALLDTSALQSDPADTITITLFTPIRITAEVSTRNTQVLTLLQSNYKGWEVLVNGERVPHFTSNKLYMSVLLEQGVHQVEFRYKNNAVKAAFVISYSVLLFVMSLVAWQWIRDRHGRRRKLLYLVCGSVILLIVIFKVISTGRGQAPEKTYRKMVAKAMKWESNHPGQTSYFFVADNPAVCKNAIEKSGAALSYDLFHHSTAENITAMHERMESLSGDYLYFSGINTHRRHEIWPMLITRFPETIKHSPGPANETLILGRKETRDSIWYLTSKIDFEAPDTNWYGPDRNLDSTMAYSGMVSNKLDSAEHYSHTFSLRADSIRLFNPVFHLSAAVCLEKGCEAYLVWEVRRKDEPIGYNTQAIHEAVKPGSWNKVFYSTTTNLRLHPDDEIRGYVWNDSKARMWVDDISVKIGKSIY